MKKKRYRSAITGRFVSEEYALNHPDTTISETITGPTIIEIVDNPFEETKKKTIRDVLLS